MKIPHILLVFTLLIYSTSLSQIGIGTLNPKSDAILDVESAEKGILIPRTNLTDLSQLAPITGQLGNGTESLLVYNTNSETGKGFYYWNGTDKWEPIQNSGNKSEGMQFYSYNFKEDAPNAPSFDLLSNRTVAVRSGSYTGSLNITNENFPTSGLIPADNTTYNGFAVKLTGFYNVKETGDFTISSTSDDGVRMYIDDSLVLADWEDSGTNSATGTVNLAKGKHKFEFWFFENAGQQRFNFMWGTNPDGLTGSIHATQFTLN